MHVARALSLDRRKKSLGELSVAITFGADLNTIIILTFGAGGRVEPCLTQFSLETLLKKEKKKPQNGGEEQEVCVPGLVLLWGSTDIFI